MELRGQFSNHARREQVDLVAALMSRSEPMKESHHLALRGARKPYIRKLMDVDDLGRRFLGGEMIKELAAEYKISESSAKRLLRSVGAIKRS